ncbi:MAG: branched-chain amino acid transaminase [Candidatus Schekmanbacteria bacterium]|nr:branched-chain amino acid transaminase [Candidatus Schekmanbacteria bacterium]
METTEKIWLNGKIIDWDDAKIHVLTHALHYSSGVFEGVRFYATPKGPAVFRLEEHTKRLFYSAGVLEMELPYSAEGINKAVTDLIRINKIKSGYIRPIAYYSYGRMGLNPSGIPVDVCVAIWPWGKYLGKDAVQVKTSKYIRIHPKSVISDAKICGYYINSILASLEVKRAGYDEALLLDYQGNVAEGPGENIFWIKNGKLFTVPPGSILLGITRDSVKTLARDMGMQVEETQITLDKLKKADEVFFTGTAAEITGVGQIDDTLIGDGHLGKITAGLRDRYLKIVGGQDEKYAHWLSYVNS